MGRGSGASPSSHLGASKALAPLEGRAYDTWLEEVGGITWERHLDFILEPMGTQRQVQGSCYLGGWPG